MKYRDGDTRIYKAPADAINVAGRSLIRILVALHEKPFESSVRGARGRMVPSCSIIACAVRSATGPSVFLRAGQLKTKRKVCSARSFRISEAVVSGFLLRIWHCFACSEGGRPPGPDILQVKHVVEAPHETDFTDSRGRLQVIQVQLRSEMQVK